MKGDVDPNQRVEEGEEQDDTEENKHRRGLTRFIAPPAPLQHIKSGLTHQVTHVHKQFADMFKVWLETALHMLKCKIMSLNCNIYNCSSHPYTISACPHCGRVTY